MSIQQPNIYNLPRRLSDSDETIVARVLAGEKEPFAVIVRRYNQRVYRTARAILRDEPEAEDVAQQVFVRAYQKLDQWSQRGSLGNWLTRIAANEAFARFRQRKRYIQIETDQSSNTASPKGPDVEVIRRQVAKLLERAVDELPDGHRAVFILRDVEELNTAETAHALEISEAAVRVRLHRARAKMRELLATELGTVTTDIFPFAGARCDRVLSHVWAQLS